MTDRRELPERRAGVIVASTRAASGIYEDTTGPLILDWLIARGYAAAGYEIVPDGDPVGEALAGMIERKFSVVITSGGTGLSPDDATPEQTEPLLERSLPGIMEAIRAAGMRKTPTAVLSRGYAGTAGGTFVVNLPGSPGGVKDGLDVLDPVLGHICDQLEGSHEH